MKTINIDNGQHKRLKEISLTTGVPMAVMVRLALDKWLENPQWAQWPRARPEWKKPETVENEETDKK